MTMFTYSLFLFEKDDHLSVVYALLTTFAFRWKTLGVTATTTVLGSIPESESSPVTRVL